MIKIKIGEKDYQLKYTLESWKKLKEEYDITPINFEEQVNKDAAGSVSAMIYFGLLPADRKNLTRDEIDASLGFDAADKVNEACIESMPDRIKKLYERNKEESEKPGKK